MINRFTFTKSEFDSLYSVAHLQKGSEQDQGKNASKLLKGLLRTARHSVTATGFVAMVILGLMFVKPDLTEHLKDLSPFSAEQAAQDAAEQAISQEDATLNAQDRPGEATVAALGAANAPAASAAPLASATLAASAPIAATGSLMLDSHAAEISPQQQRVTQWISRRYRVAKDATNVLVSAAYNTAKDIKIDPLLILAVVAIESRFNPLAESPVGAQGLMQVMSKVHRDRFADHGGVKAALNPVANIQVGAEILKEYVRRGGSVEAGLKMYVGAANLETDDGYGAKVLAEYQRLKDVAGGKKVPAMTTVSRTPPKPVEKIEEPKTEAMLNKPSDFSVKDQPA